MITNERFRMMQPPGSRCPRKQIEVKEGAVFVKPRKVLPLPESLGRGVNRCVSGQSAERVIK